MPGVVSRTATARSRRKRALRLDGERPRPARRRSGRARRSVRRARPGRAADRGPARAAARRARRPPCRPRRRRGARRSRRPPAPTGSAGSGMGRWLRSATVCWESVSMPARPAADADWSTVPITRRSPALALECGEHGRPQQRRSRRRGDERRGAEAIVRAEIGDRERHLVRADERAGAVEAGHLRAERGANESRARRRPACRARPRRGPPGSRRPLRRAAPRHGTRRPRRASGRRRTAASRRSAARRRRAR